MRSAIFLAVCSTLPAISHAFSSIQRRVDSTLANVTPPSDDPWYTAPAGYVNATPGAVLRVRPAPGNLTVTTGNASAVYNILYRTTDSRYNASWAVTTLFVPESPVTSNATGSNILLSYQIPYDSADVDAGPSYALYANPESDIELALSNGWYVNVPDFEGPLASFTAGVESGHATLDSVRAVLNSGHGLCSKTKYALWGYSGGALASEWAAELQVQYAPELQFAGAALGGLTPNITNVLLAVNGGAAAGLGPEGILGLASQYPELESFLKQSIKTSGPYNATTFFNAANQTLDEALVTFFNQQIIDYFTDGAEIFGNPAVQDPIYRDGLMGYHGVPQMPLFAYKAIQDEISPIADTDELVSKYCNVGASIWYQRNTVGNHEIEQVNSDAAAFEWLAAALTGDVQTGCKVENVTRSAS